MNTVSEEQLLQFEQDGFMILKDFLSVDANTNLQHYVVERHRNGDWAKAQIGKGAATIVNEEQRGDFIEWLDPANKIPALVPYWELVQQLHTTLNRNFFMGLNFFEAHMACYPSGSFYKRHADRHVNGSTRKVSFVYYLNSDWTENSGGLLNIFYENETKATINPLLGHCIVFLSELEHEVTTSEKERYSITGWFHQKMN
jgi:SM-20-related protein